MTLVARNSFDIPPPRAAARAEGTTATAETAALQPAREGLRAGGGPRILAVRAALALVGVLALLCASLLALLAVATGDTATALLGAAAGKAAAAPAFAQAELAACAGDTREDGRCAHDETHRVCAKIGEAGTSFWKFTGQTSWCGNDNYGDGRIACPPAQPTWCICKWATAEWIKGETCNPNIEIDCAATDLCATADGLFFSYVDGDVNLGPAHDCIAKKCAAGWAACAAQNPAA
jgi:hypothetical protein